MSSALCAREPITSIQMAFAAVAEVLSGRFLNQAMVMLQLHVTGIITDCRPIMPGAVVYEPVVLASTCNF